ncbi:hypothetical protein M2322_000633 [Rhodoblastus acidophilus]|uniref:hypothetical protein n=1 Tax=Rhodoblastus acidophilus TaxID=1074 RepID=UPI002224B9BE|nr:hypothetical protein [Rhodoblastus acidophilus]MCW2315113.1 hypothetical protein [Rhodoblastus acidophilus]
MKMICLALTIFTTAASSASAQYYNYGGTGANPAGHQVQGYVRSDGGYVAPHYQSNPNGTTYDNYDTRGNVNPYTGHVGTRNPY